MTLILLVLFCFAVVGLLLKWADNLADLHDEQWKPTPPEEGENESDATHW